jgi:Cys-tRNA(Pro)/Cys-tRNA(Cys) deacylase
MTPVNNVTRLLDSRKVTYTAHELPSIKLGALEAAQLLRVPPGYVYKTIVIVREKPKKPVLAVIPGPLTVDLKLLAQILDEKKVHLPTEREAEKLTGLQAGGISPLALINKGFLVIIDSSAEHLNRIFISGGIRDLNIELAPADLSKLTQAQFAVISRSS